MKNNRLTNNFFQIKNDIKDFMEFCKSNILSIILVVVFTFIAYGIKVFNYSISIDTEMLISEYNWQLDTWATFGRFGLVLTKKLFGLNPFNAYVSCFLMIIAMIVFGMTWSYVLNYFSFEKNKKSLVNFIFPIIFITAPLFAEQFNFILQGFEVAFAIILCSLAVFFISKWTIHSENILYVILALICMIWSFGTYQAIVFLYISGVLACYILTYIANKQGNVKLSENYFRISVFKYLGTFIVGYVSYYVVDKVIRNIHGASEYVDGMIKWGQIPAEECIKNVLRYIKGSLLGDGVFYSKVFLVCIIVLIIYSIINLFSKNKDKFLFLSATGAFIISPFLLSIYIGNNLIPRMQFNYQFVIAFTVYMLSRIIRGKNWNTLVILFAICIAFNQSYTVVRLFTSEQLKYEDDVILANKIADRIERLELGEVPEYPVVLVGRHTNYRPNRLTGEFIGASWFEFGGNSQRALGFMKTLGYNYVSPTQEEIERGHEVAEDMEAWPNNNSVLFKEGVIVVKLSE